MMDKKITGTVRPKMLLLIAAILIMAAILSPINISAANPDVVIAYKTHFDIGYTDSAANVIQRYRTAFIDGALDTIDSSAGMPPDRRFVWTVAGWPMKKMSEDWSGQTDTRRVRIANAFANKRLAVHALPYTTHTESLDLEDLVRGMVFSSDIARKYRQPLPRGAKMTDVPSHSWIMPTLLKNAGVNFLHLGCNPACSSPTLPRMFFWEGPDGSRLLTFYDAADYGGGLLPPGDWTYPVWFAMRMTGDNQGPPSNSTVNSEIDTVLAAGKTPKIGQLEEFADLILAGDTSGIPVIRGDMPDTWIHGIASMPVETKMTRNLRPEIMALDALNTLLCLQGRSPADVSSNIYSAYEHSDRYGEHTWGRNDGVAPDHLFGSAWQTNKNSGAYNTLEASWAEKGDEARGIDAAITSAYNTNLNALATAVNVSGKRIVVYNSLPWSRSGLVKVQVTGAAPVALQDATTGTAVPVSVSGNEVSFIATNVPSLGYRTYQYAASAPPPGTLSYSSSANTIENEYLKVTLSPSNGAVTSIIEKSSGRELVETGRPYGFGQYLNERFGTSDINNFLTAYCKMTGGWAYDDLGKNGLPQSSYSSSKATGMTVAYSQTNTAVSAVMSKGATSGYQGMTIKISLYPGQKYVEFDWSLNTKTEDPWPEADWLCFPFKVTGAQFKLQRVGGIVNPAADFIEGSNHYLWAVEGGVAIVGSDGKGVGLCSKDAPLVSLDEPGIWKYNRTRVPSVPNVLINLYNNQWDTNFQEWTRNSWSVTTRVWAFDTYNAESSVVTPSEETRVPLRAAMVDTTAGSSPKDYSGLTLSRKGVLVTAFGPNPDGSGTVLRLWEQSGTDGNCTVTLPSQFNVPSVQPVDLRGQAAGSPISVNSGQFSVNLTHNGPKSFLINYTRSNLPAPTSTPTMPPTFTPAATPSPTPLGNIAPQASVTASSVYSGNYAASKVTDGIIGIQDSGEWASAGELNPWIQLTWSANKTINKIILYDRNNLTDNANGGTLSFSDSSTINVTGIPAEGTAKEITFANKTVTWVKFQVSGGAGQNVGLSEMAVYETGGATPTPTPTPAPVANLAFNKTATADSYFQAGQAPGKAVDGIATGSDVTKWASQYGETHWLQVDLGQAYSIARYVVKHAGGFETWGTQSINTRDFKFQVSSDAINWTDLDTVTGNTANVTDHNVTGTGRYARLYITNPQTETTYRGARIYELEVYENTAPITPTPTPTVGPTATPTPTPAGLVGYWKFDETSGTAAADSSGNGNTGSVSGGANWSTGKVGGALSFDGTDDKVTVNDSATLDLTAFTVAMWIYMDALPASGKFYALAVKGDDAYENYELLIGHPNSGNIHFPIKWSDGTRGTDYTATQLTAGSWKHLVLTYDGANVKVYIDAALDTTKTYNKTPAVNNNALIIGNEGSLSRFFKGKMDELRIYNRVLTEQEITGLYNYTGN